MSLDADAFVERRRLKRGLFWRLAALAAVVAAVAVGIARRRRPFAITSHGSKSRA